MTVAEAQAALAAAEAEYKRMSDEKAAAEQVWNSACAEESTAHYALSAARTDLECAKIEEEEAALPRFMYDGCTYVLLGWTRRGAARARLAFNRAARRWGAPRPNIEFTLSTSRRSLAKNPELAALVAARSVT